MRRSLGFPKKAAALGVAVVLAAGGCQATDSDPTITEPTVSEPTVTESTIMESTITETTVDQSTPTSSVEELTLPEAVTMDDAGATKLTVTPFADWVVVAGGSAWVAVGTSVTRLDGSTGEEIASVPVEGETCLAMDVGFDAIWVGACRTGSPSIVRIDPTSGEILATVSLPIDNLQPESSVAAGEGAVWALSQGASTVLIKVDPETNEVVDNYPMPSEPSGYGGVRAAYGSVWVSVPARDVVLQIDPESGAVAQEIEVGGGPRFLAVGEDSVWAMNENVGSVSRIDPTSGTLIATIPVSNQRVNGGDIAFGGGSVWARISDQLVSRIDPAQNEVVERYGPPLGSGSVAADDDAAWISAHDVNTVWRLPLNR